VDQFVTAATAFKHLGITIAAIILAGVAALGGMALLIPTDSARKAAEAEIRSATGLDISLRGEATVTLFPTGSVSFANVALGDGPESALAADRLTARLRFLPLFVGRIEITDVALVNPRINVIFGEDGRSNWAGLIDTLARAVGPKARRPDPTTSFSEIRIERGTITVRDARGLNETLHNVELALAWPSISRSFGATGRFVWHGEPVDASFGLTDFSAALAGNRSGLKVRLNGAPLKLAFEGALSARPTLKIDGTLAADAASLRDTLRWAGIKPLTGSGFGRFALKAKTNVAGGTISLSSVNIELDGNSAEGVLTFATDGRQTLQGTLAADTLDLSPYVSTVRLLTSNERDWNRVPIMLDGLNSFDLDLRLSAARITAARANFGRTAIAANLRGGKLTVTIGESQAFGGILKGSFVIAASSAGADVKSQLQFTDVELESCLKELFNLSRIEGRGDVAVAVDASGSSVLALTRTLNGTANLIGRQGAIVGLNVEPMLRRLEKRPLSGAGDFRNGRTPFEKLTINLKIVQGTATVEDVRLEGSKLRLNVTGSATIPSREFDLKGVAALVANSGSDTPATFELPFFVQGPWDDPFYSIEPHALLMRSPAATPLLEAVKSRTTRDTVRSAIERLTGGAPPAAAPTAPAAAPGQPAAAAPR
jgi:AsmA protein